MQINGYTLIEPPYKGGMALVYKGQKGGFSRAFKFVRPDKAANNTTLVQQFLKEIQLQTILDHPNIVKILDAYPHQQPNGNSFTVLEMEWLNGLDLQSYIEQNAKSGLDEATIKKIAIQVLDGLQYAHDHNILHLDIKPSNLFRTTDGYIKIIDFGIARVVGENAAIVDGAEKLTLTTETGESSYKGTLAYASPEQQVGAKVGYTSDIYSFGKVLHFLSTGSTDPSCEVKSPQLAAIITKCTMQNPKHRYQTCKEIKEVLEESDKPKLIKCINPKCGKMIPPSVKYCPECGTVQIVKTEDNPKEKCPKCGNLRKDKDRFCDKCGHKFGDPLPSESSSSNTQKSKVETIGSILFWIIFIGAVITCGILGLPVPAALIIVIVALGLGSWVYSWFQ